MDEIIGRACALVSRREQEQNAENARLREQIEDRKRELDYDARIDLAKRDCAAAKEGLERIEGKAAFHQTFTGVVDASNWKSYLQYTLHMRNSLLYPSIVVSQVKEGVAVVIGDDRADIERAMVEDSTVIGGVQVCAATEEAPLVKIEGTEKLFGTCAPSNVLLKLLQVVMAHAIRNNAPPPPSMYMKLVVNAFVANVRFVQPVVDDAAEKRVALDLFEESVRSFCVAQGDEDVAQEAILAVVREIRAQM